MQQAVHTHFPTESAVYRFTNRTSSDRFSSTSTAAFRESVSAMGLLRLTKPERAFLEQASPYLKPAYLDYLENEFRFKPEQVHVDFFKEEERDGEEYGGVEVWTEGTWLETILWEVPLMASLCEAYFDNVDTDWDYDGQDEIAYKKTKAMLDAGCVFSEFGTRRRRSFKTHDIVVGAAARAAQDYEKEGGKKGKLVGTSNVYLAMKHKLMPSGTIAHEWFMGVAALRGYTHGTRAALELWESIYPFPLLLTLTDTFSSPIFFKSFTSPPITSKDQASGSEPYTDASLARRWRGLRQDSGDPFVFAPAAKVMYERVGLTEAEWREKVIVYSDGVSMEKAIKLREHCEEIGFKPMFGIGTNYTNEFMRKSSGGKERSPALNVVIKLAQVGGKPCVKISDELSKNTGNVEEVRKVKELFGLPTS